MREESKPMVINNRDMAKRYHKIFTDCVSSSSAHGIGKILKESLYIFKFLWAILFIGAVVIFSFHSSTLIRRWNEMPTSVEIMVSQEKFEMPDIYVCPTNIFSRYNEKELMTKESKELRQNITENIKAIKKTFINGSEYDEFMFLSVLWRHIDIKSLYDYFAVKPTDWILGGFADKEVLGISHFQTMPDYEFIYCVKISLSTILKEHGAKTFTMLFYLKSLSISPVIAKHFQIEGIDFYNLDFLHFLRSKQNLQLFMVSKNYARTDASNYITLKGDRYYHLTVSTSKFQMINRPQNPCINTNGSKIFTKDFYNFLDPKNPIKILPNSICEGIEKQKYMFKEEKCYLKLEYLPNDLMKKDQWCDKDGYLIDVSGEMRKACKKMEPCNTITYALESNVGELPDYVKMRGYLKPLKNFFSSNAMTLLEDDSYTESNVSQMEAMKKNYIEVTIEFNDKKLFYQEKLSYTFTNLLSDIGGIFGFYMGISVLTLCELLVLLCHMTRSTLKKNDEMILEEQKTCHCNDDVV